MILGHVLTSQDAGGTADSEVSGGDTISFVDGKAVVGDRVEHGGERQHMKERRAAREAGVVREEREIEEATGATRGER